MSVETVLETDFEPLKLLLSVESGFEVRFGSANEKLHVHAILGLGKKKSRSIMSGKIIIIDCSASP